MEGGGILGPRSIREQPQKRPSWIGLKNKKQSLTHEKINRIQISRNWQLIRDWREIKQENMIHIYAVTIIDVTGVE